MFSQVAVRWHTTMTRSIVSVAIVLIVGARPTEANEGEIRERFSRDYLEHGQLLLKSFSDVRVRFETATPLAGGRSHVWRTEGRFNRHNILLKATSLFVEPNRDPQQPAPEFKPPTIECSNQRYKFALKPGTNHQYVLDGVYVFDSTRTIGHCTMSCPFMDWQRSLTFCDMTSDPNTLFLDYSDCTYQQKRAKCLRIQYSFFHQRAEKPFTMINNFYFAPDEHWACIGLVLRTNDSNQNPGYGEFVYHYEPSASGPPTLKRIDNWSRNTQKPQEDRITSTTDVLEYVPIPPIPDEEFRLTKFGFPEPEGIIWEKPKSRRYLWFLLAGGISLTLGFLFFRRRARAAKM